MKIVLLVNPASGKGRGIAAADEIAAALRAHDTRIVTTRASDHSGHMAWLTKELSDGGADLCVVIGGDGTMNAALPALLECQVAVYHAAMGTENLFAREFDMRPRDGETLGAKIVGAVARHKVIEVDIGTVWIEEVRETGAAVSPQPTRLGQPRDGVVVFALMASLGPDAGVVRRLSAARKGPITHRSYLGPIFQEMRSPYLPRVSIQVDGRSVVDAERGMVVVANSRQYALRMNPAYRASMTDGLLDVVFFPAQGALQTVQWLFAARLGSRGRDEGLTYVQGKHVRINAEALDSGHHHALQVDGDELPLQDHSSVLTLDFALCAAKLQVLCSA